MPSPARPPILSFDPFNAQLVTRRATTSGPLADRTGRSPCPVPSSPARPPEWSR